MEIFQLIFVPLGMLKDILKHYENIPSGKASFPRWRSKWQPGKLKMELYFNRIECIQMIFHMILVPLDVLMNVQKESRKMHLPERLHFQDGGQNGGREHKLAQFICYLFTIHIPSDD